VEPIVPQQQGLEHCYPSPAREFQLSYFDLSGSELRVPITGAEIWLVTSGSVALAAQAKLLTLTSGRSAFVQARSRELRVAGTGRVFRARVAHSA
jgi:mannose-6-phosphate isomerase class I